MLPFARPPAATLLLQPCLHCSWALDSLTGRVAEATRPDAVERAYGQGGAASAASSPRIGAVGGERVAAAGGFNDLVALAGPGGAGGPLQAWGCSGLRVRAPA